MKMKKVTAILMSLSMVISTCLPMSGTTALAAEIPGIGETAAVSAQEASETDAEDYEEGEAASEEEPEETVSAQTDPADPETAEETEEEAEADRETDSAENDGEDFEPDTQKEESAEAADTSSGSDGSQSAASTEEGTASYSEPVAEEIEESSETKDAAKGEDYTGRDYDNPIDITLGSEAEVTVSDTFGYYFRFIPEEDGPYDFCVTTETDGIEPNALLYDEEGWSMQAYLNQTGDHEFRLSADLTAGKAYTFSISFPGDLGNVTVHV
ncbi:MAG TPA: hypothetical protein DCF49_07905, partial [Lachnospiraceae bacterium]|nr:hypothetical protein [Lachnospiraceae bacterium]